MLLQLRRSNVSMQLWSPDGKLERQWCGHNLIVDLGEALVANMLVGTGAAPPTHAAVGSNGSEPLSTNTGLLGTEHYRVALVRMAVGSVVNYEATFTGVSSNKTVREAGLFNNAVGGTLFARWLTTDFVLAVGGQFYFKWFAEIAREA